MCFSLFFRILLPLFILNGIFAEKCNSNSNMRITNFSAASEKCSSKCSDTAVCNGTILVKFSAIRYECILDRMDPDHYMVDSDYDDGHYRLCPVFSPIHLAAAAGNLEEIQKLISQQGEDGLVNLLDKWNKSALHYAVLGNSSNVVKFLLENGANLNAIDAWNNSALFYAIEEGNEDIVEILLHVPNVNIGYVNGKTPLHVAVNNGKLKIAKMLVQKGADVNARGGSWLQTPLHRAAWGGGNLKIAKFLLDSGADVNAQNVFLETPLHEAISSFSDKTDLVALLIANGADVNARDSSGNTPLHKAAGGHSLGVVNLLLENGAEIDAISADEYPVTPLENAIRSGNLEMVKFLLAKGANPGANAENGTPLMEAVIKSSWQTTNYRDASMEIVHLIVNHSTKAIINARDRRGRTALFNAAWYKNFEAVQMLLDNGADVDPLDENGWTPLHWLAHNNIGPDETAKMARMLLQNGANPLAWTERPNDRNEGGGQIPLHLAIRNGDRAKEMVKLLIEYGGKNSVNIKTRDGHSPLEIAKAVNSIKYQGNAQIIQLLLDAGAN